LDGSDSGDSILQWETPITLNAMSGWQTEAGQLTSGTPDQVSQSVAVTVRWATGDPEMPTGYYCGYVKLIVEAGGQSAECVLRVYMKAVPNIAVGFPPGPTITATPPTVVLPDSIQPGQIPAQVTFRIDASVQTMDMCILCTHLHNSGSPASGQMIPLAGPGVVVHLESGNEIQGGFDNLLEWATAYVASNGMAGRETVTGTFASGQDGFGQYVTVNVGWNASEGGLPAGEYQGVIALVGEGVTACVEVCVNVTSANQPPIAAAGEDQIVEQEGPEGSQVTLDGSWSSDPDGDSLTYTWTWADQVAYGVAPVVTLAPGLTAITLTVFDGQLSATDTVDVTVRDTTAPVVTGILANPNVLWPPNGRMVRVTVAVNAEDNSGQPPACAITDVTCSESVTDADWQRTEDPLAVMLRAEHGGSKEARIYTIHVECMDASLNTATATVDVTVPRAPGRGKKPHS